MHHFNFPPKSQVKLLPRLGHFLVETFLNFPFLQETSKSVWECVVLLLDPIFAQLFQFCKPKKFKARRIYFIGNNLNW